jgi:hypothetical protein
VDINWLNQLGVNRLIAAAVAVLVFVALLRLFKRKPQSAHTEAKRCGSCGWTGEVSRYKPVCPRCAARLP